jgi:hypothetical protein
VAFRLRGWLTRSERPDQHGPPRTSAHLLPTLFILFHVFFITLWAFPFNASLTGLLRKWIGHYFSLAGLRQEWSLFAPNPISVNSYIDAQVVLQNGALQTWTFPRIERLKFTERYSKARYRKFTGWLYRKNFAYAWPDAARYVARQFKGSAMPPRTVTLVRHWVSIPPITLQEDTLPAWHSFVFFVYQIPPGDLE